MRSFATVATIAALPILFAAAPAHADYFPPASERPTASTPSFSLGRHSGAMRHDRGFFLRPELGFGYLSAYRDNVTATGLDYTLGLSVGGTVAEGLVLHGMFTVSSAPEVKYEVDDATASLSGVDYTLTVTSIGFGLTYYTPSNAWFSGGIGPHVTTLSTSVADSLDCPAGDACNYPDTGSDSDFGLGLRVGAGYEWWVTDEWAIGLGAHVFGATGQDWTSYGMDTVFTASFN
jgi:opacity protein-like surface antigen